MFIRIGVEMTVTGGVSAMLAVVLLAIIAGPRRTAGEVPADTVLLYRL